MAVKNFIKQVTSDESILVFDVFFSVDILDQEPPETRNNIGDHEHDDDKSEYLVRVHHHILGLDTIRSC